MEHLQIGSRHYNVASTWDELRAHQLLPILAELRGSERPDRRLRLLALLLGQSIPNLLRGVPPVGLVQLLDLSSFLFDEGCRLTAQLLPEVRLPWRHDWRHRIWVGPQGNFRNICFGEFIFSDTYFVHFSRTGRIDVLDKFIATLYRPKRPGAGPHKVDYAGDLRQPFNEHLLDHYTRRLRYLPVEVKHAVLVWYRGCRAQLVDEYPEVFTPARQAQAAKSDWSRVLRQLSGGAFGALDQTARQPLRTILAEIQDNLREYEQAQTHANRSQS